MARRSKKAQFFDELEALAESLRTTIELEVDGFDTDPQAQQARVSRAAADYGYFCRTYFPHYYDPDKKEPAPSTLQRHLFARLPEIATNGQGDHDAIAAPRGETKSTTCSMAFPIWCVAYGHKRFPILFSDTYRQAAEQLEAVKAELEFNPRLKADYPEHAGRGRVWKEGVIVTHGNAKMQAFGAGTKVRGLRHGPHRPDLAVLDDLENDENVRSLEQRDKLHSWLMRTVLPLGPPDGSMDVLYIGTVLHYDAVLSRVLNSPLWQARHFRSIIEFPDRTDLWDQWEEALHNEGPEAARAFYDDRRSEMELGAVVSWPAVRPLYALMLIRADDRAAFDSEHQNDPVSLENNPFAAAMSFWVNRLDDWVFYGALDPSLGKQNKARDPSAIGIGGLNRQTGILDIVEADIRRRVPDKIIMDVIAYQREYHCLLWGVEIIQFQEMLKDELVKRSAALGVPVPAKGIRPSTDKALRIESLHPHMANGLIRLHPRQKVLIEQFRHWPDADHDDGPDMVEMLWQVALAGPGYLYKFFHMRGV